jgi:hypothetical protein
LGGEGTDMTRIENAVKMVKEMFPQLPEKSAVLLAQIIEQQLNKSKN